MTKTSVANNEKLINKHASLFFFLMKFKNKNVDLYRMNFLILRHSPRLDQFSHIYMLKTKFNRIYFSKKLNYDIIACT